MAATDQRPRKRKLHKEILRKPRVQRVACRLGAAYIRLCWRTTRWRRIGFEHAQARWRAGEPFIAAFWHGRILMMPYAWDFRHGMGIHMMISDHRDGQLVSGTVKHFGIHTIVSSSSSSGPRGFRALLHRLKQGDAVGITPDGPRGPGMHIHDGILQAARMSGRPILPTTYAVSRRKVLGSWDRFIVALPFARGVIAWGEPIHVARDADEAAFETARRQLADALNRLTAEADLACGQTPITPHPDRPPEAERPERAD